MVYTGTWSGVVLKSSTAGASWAGVSVDPQQSNPVLSLAVDPTSPTTVWAGASGGTGAPGGKVFKSTDGGGSWAYVPAATIASPGHMTFDGGTLYIGNDSSSGSFSLVKTGDKGASWTYLTIRGNLMPVRGITARNDVVYVATQAFSDAFLFKVDTNATSNSIMWGTYIGGSLDDAAVGVAVDPAGNPVVAIRTTSHDFPKTAAADYRPSAVARVSSDGSSYTVSSYAGPAAAGPGSLGIAGIALDSNGVAYITGQRIDSASDRSIWVNRVEPAGATTAEYVLNGSHSNVGSIADSPTGIAVDRAGGVYLTGSTSAFDFPTTPNAPQPSYGSGSSDAFISKVSFSDVATPPGGTNIALNKPVVVSSTFAPQYAGAYTVDGSPTTRWSSVFSDPQWLYVDLGQTYTVSEVILRWETAFGADYQVQLSDDAATWTTIRSVTNGDGDVDDLTGLAGTGRYLRILGTRRGTQWGYSLWELEAFGTPSTPPPPPGGLPSPWVSHDVGAVGTPGSASHSAGVFTLKGSGADIWGVADGFQFVYQVVNGDSQIVARVTGVQNTNPYAKAGVMFRDGTGASAADVILDVKPDGCVEFMSRPSANTATAFVAGSACEQPAWLRLSRIGSTFSAAVSADGATWSAVGTTTVTMAATAAIGLAVTSHDNAALNTSTFDTVSVTAPSGAPPPSSNIVIDASDVPAASVHGSWAKSSDATSAGGVKLATTDVGMATTLPVANPTDYVDVTFNAPAGTKYTLWLRLQALGNSKFNDSAWVQFSDALANGSSVYPVGTTDALLVNLATDSAATSLNGWGWQNTAYWLSQATTVTFAAGAVHTLRIQVREDGVQFDQIVLSPSQYLSASPGPLSNDSTIVAK